MEVFLFGVLAIFLAFIFSIAAKKWNIVFTFLRFFGILALLLVILNVGIAIKNYETPAEQAASKARFERVIQQYLERDKERLKQRNDHE